MTPCQQLGEEYFFLSFFLFFSCFLLHPCIPSLSLSLSFIKIFHFVHSFVCIQMFQFLPTAILPSLSSFEETQKAVTTERLYLKEVTEPSFTQQFSDLCCQFVSVNLWGSCLCVCLSLARCAGWKPRQGLKPQIPFPIIHIAVIIVCFDVFSPVELKV